MRIRNDDTILGIVPLLHANAWGLPYAALLAGANVLMPERFLQTGGPWITSSYYSPAGAQVDPSRFDDGWLRTVDVGKISPDGYLALVDRSKDVIKSGGEWISSVDLENAVMGHPAVAEAAVIGIPDEKWDERPLVVIVAAEGATVEPAELRAFLADRFAKWQLPEYWAFITEVPKTSVGKFDKKRLRAQHADGSLNVTTVC